MFNLIAVTFSALKNAAIAVAAINAAVLTAALVCLFFAHRFAKKEETDKASSSVDSPK